MPFQISAGVNITEIDLTTVIPAVSTTVGGIAGRFNWGPADKLVLIDKESTLQAQFWKPDSNNYQEWFSAANFLAYANALQVSRVLNGANNATASGNTSTLIKNDDDYENNYSSGIAGIGDWVAKYPGALGNSLKVSVCQGANAWASTLAANLVFQAGNTTVLTKGANVSVDLTSGPNINLSASLTDGDVLFYKSATVNLGDGISVASANSTAIVLDTAPTQDQLSTTDDSTRVQSASIERRWEYYNYFDAAPGTSDYATTAGGTNDEMHIAIVDEDGEWTQVRGQVIDRYANLSRANDAKSTDGRTTYYKEVINQRSPYLWWASHVDVMTSAGGAASSTFTNTSDVPQTVSMSGGSDGAAPTNAQLINGYNKFESAEDVDVSFILGADSNSTLAIHIINNICETRKDCIVCLSPESADVVNNSTYAGKEAEDAIAFRNLLPSSSYAVLDGAWKYQYDKYNDVYRYVPLNGDIAGLMVRTDIRRDPWWSPGGFNRGRIKNVVKLSYNPKKAERDLLYKAGINPVVTFPGEGTVLYGDKTMLTKPSAFDRINVRRLFITLEKAIATAAKYTLFEFNDTFTRSQFRNMVEPFLRDVQGRRGVTDFKVVCDDTNNTPEVIDRNEFIGDIYIKPARSINFIQLNFIAVRTGVDFEEIVGQF